MHSSRYAVPLVMAVTLLISPAFAQQAGHVPSPIMPGMAGGQNAGTAPVNPADHAMMAGMEKMNQAMRDVPITGDTDRDFVAMMIPHHQGAIAMAQVELQHGKDPLLRKMAKGIVTAQEQEIAEMRRWQAKHHPHS